MSETSRRGGDWQRWEAPTVGARRDGKAASSRQVGGSADAAPTKQEPAREPDSAGSQVTAAEVESIQQAAYREAWDQGYREGFAKGQEAAAEQADSLRRLMDAMSDPLADLERDIEQQLSDLVGLIARKVIRRELHTDPGQIVAVVREAAAALRDSSGSMHFQLNPEDVDLVRELLGDHVDTRWELIEDPGISRGGCIVSADNSRVDMRLEQQIGRVLAVMLGDEREVLAEDTDVGDGPASGESPTGTQDAGVSLDDGGQPSAAASGTPDETDSASPGESATPETELNDEHDR